MTSTIRGAPSEVRVGVEEGLKHLSAVNLDHVQTIAKHRLHQFLGTLGPEKMRQVCRALAIATGCAGGAAANEQAMPFEFGPPVAAKPTPELLAGQLLAAGRAAEAEKAYRVALRRTPGRATVVAGLERARVQAAGAGERSKSH